MLKNLALIGELIREEHVLVQETDSRRRALSTAGEIISLRSDRSGKEATTVDPPCAIKKRRARAPA